MISGRARATSGKAHITSTIVGAHTRGTKATKEKEKDSKERIIQICFQSHCKTVTMCQLILTIVDCVFRSTSVVVMQPQLVVSASMGGICAAIATARHRIPSVSMIVSRKVLD